jgi:hypothetical protein
MITELGVRKMLGLPEAVELHKATATLLDSPRHRLEHKKAELLHENAIG